MPIDASIPLQQTQDPSYLQTLGQVYATKNAQQENQLRGLQGQGAQMALQNRSALAQAYRNNVTRDQQGNPQFNRQGGEADVMQNAPRLHPQVIQQGIEMQKRHLSILDAQNNYEAQHLQRILNAPPEQKQTVYTASRNQMIQEGVLQPGSPNDPGAVYPGDDTIARLMASTMTAKDQIAAQQKLLAVQTARLTQQETARHNLADEPLRRQSVALANQAQALYSIPAQQRTPGQVAWLKGYEQQMQTQDTNPRVAVALAHPVQVSAGPNNFRGGTAQGGGRAVTHLFNQATGKIEAVNGR